MVYFVFTFIFIVLARASYVDFKEGLLPNGLMLSFLVLACGFHIITEFRFLSYSDMVIGGLVSLGLMGGLYWAASHYYGHEAFGQGDVKLLAVAGVWLGVEHFMLALCIGAIAGLLHGAILAGLQFRKTGVWPNFSTLSMPAGPGFIIGILAVGAVTYLIP